MPSAKTLTGFVNINLLIKKKKKKAAFLFYSLQMTGKLAIVGLT